jgi:hypothetical protein
MVKGWEKCQTAERFSASAKVLYKLLEGVWQSKDWERVGHLPKSDGIRKRDAKIPPPERTLCFVWRHGSSRSAPHLCWLAIPTCADSGGNGADGFNLERQHQFGES